MLRTAKGRRGGNTQSLACRSGWVHFFFYLRYTLCILCAPITMCKSVDLRAGLEIRRPDHCNLQGHKDIGVVTI